MQVDCDRWRMVRGEMGEKAGWRKRENTGETAGIGGIERSYENLVTWKFSVTYEGDPKKNLVMEDKVPKARLSVVELGYQPSHKALNLLPALPSRGAEQWWLRACGNH